jgi:regulator of cell morphogenesis and NO signaling
MDANTNLGELVKARPELAGVFERLGLDFCCGGHRTLADACAERGLDAATVLKMIESMPREGLRTANEQAANEPDVAGMNPTELVDHIESTHHEYLKRELPQIAELVTRVRGAHGKNHPELVELERTFGEFAAEIRAHLGKEEQVLFPAVRSFAASGQPTAALEGPMRVMETEHDTAGAMLARMRDLTGDYTVPQDGCESYRALNGALADLERDTHRHIHKENNVLFPLLRGRSGASEAG